MKYIYYYIYVYAIIIYFFSNIIIFITYQYLFKMDSAFLFIALPRPWIVNSNNKIIKRANRKYQVEIFIP